MRKNHIAAVLSFVVTSFVLMGFATPSQAAKCGGDFDQFVAAMSAEAAAAGISRGVIDYSLVKT